MMVEDETRSEKPAENERRRSAEAKSEGNECRAEIHVAEVVERDEVKVFDTHFIPTILYAGGLCTAFTAVICAGQPKDINIIVACTGLCGVLVGLFIGFRQDKKKDRADNKKLSDDWTLE